MPNEIAPGDFAQAVLNYLRESLNGSDQTRMQAIAEAFVDQGLETKDLAFFKQIADIVDGKGKGARAAAIDAVADRVLEIIETAATRAAEAFAQPLIIEGVAVQIAQPAEKKALQAMPAAPRLGELETIPVRDIQSAAKP